MTRLATAVQRAAEAAVSQGAAGWMLATVTAVGAAGTVDVTTATGPALAVRYLRRCRPAVGDTVMVVTSPAGNWLVIDALASGPGFVHLARSADWILPASTYTGVAWDVRVDGASAMTPAAGTPTQIPLTAGSWLVHLQQTWPAGATQARTRIRRADGVEFQTSFMSSSAGGQGDSGSVPIFIPSPTYIEVQLYSTAAITVPAAYSTVLVERVRG